jgi:SWIM zinc finger
MADERDWVDAALWALLRQSCHNISTDLTCGRTSTGNVTADEPSGQLVAFVHERLNANDLLLRMHALVPRATQGALAMFDHILQTSSRADMFGDTGQRLANPRVLGRVVHCIFARDDGRCIVQVGSSTGLASGASSLVDHRKDHVVIISGICVSTGSDAFFYFSRDGDAERDHPEMPYTSCDCRSFQFSSGNEFHCKHIVAAGLAVAANLASYSTVCDDDFIRILQQF